LTYIKETEELISVREKSCAPRAKSPAPPNFDEVKLWVEAASAAPLPRPRRAPRQPAIHWLPEPAAGG
jgi:hypothetical protein